MGAEVLTPDDVNSTFISAIGPSQDIEEEFVRRFGALTEADWESLGAGVQIIRNSGLIRVTFSFEIDRMNTGQRRELRQRIADVARSVETAHTESQLIRFQFDEPQVSTEGPITRTTCLARGIIA